MPSMSGASTKNPAVGVASGRQLPLDGLAAPDVDSGQHGKREKVFA
jgi:hypothetical protein